MRDSEQPWFPRALEALDLRRKDRLLLFGPGAVAPARAAAHLIGPQGVLTILEPRRRVAEAIAAELPAADVLAMAPVGDECFGSFDAVLAVPFCGPLPGITTWPGMLTHNLRPGGRFALDLPAPHLLPDVCDAALLANLACADRMAENLSGPDPDAVVQALLDAGLRRVETRLGTHLLQFESPFDLAELVAPAANLDEDQRIALGEALARKLGSTSAIETLAHRTSVTGMR